MALRFSTPIHFNFTDKETVEFSSIEDCQQWAEHERQIWRGIQEQWNNSSLPKKKQNLDFNSQIKPYDDLYNACASALSANDADSHKDTLIAHLQKIKNAFCVRASSVVGKKVLALAEKDLWAALMTMCGLNPNFFATMEWLAQPIMNQSTAESKQRFTNIIQGFANAFTLERGEGLPQATIDAVENAVKNAELSNISFQDKLREQEDIILEAKNSVEKVSEAAKQQEEKIDGDFKNLSARIEADLKVITDNAKAEIDTLKTQIALHEPIKYWKDAFVSYRLASTGWATAFFLMIVVTGCSFVVYARSLVASGVIDLHKIGIEEAIIFFMIPMFFGVWIIKVLAKRYQANFHLMNDAKNREVMTKAFLSLAAGNHASAQDKILMLNALFRPTPDIKYDDDAPVHWFDILADKIQDQKGKKD